MKKKILYIHPTNKKLKYGAQYINALIIKKLKTKGYIVDTVYPENRITILNDCLAGINSILFYYSLISKKKQSKKYNIIQGTTFTVLPFLENGVPVISHFGSTTCGFLETVPTDKKLYLENMDVFSILSHIKLELKINNNGVSIKSLQDINKMEIEVAKKSTAVIATSKNVEKELIKNGVKKNKIFLVYNAIEDYWFKQKLIKKVKPTANLVYIGRMGDDVFTIKLKGISRLIWILKQFPNLNKKIIGLCSKYKEYESVFSKIPNTKAILSLEKQKIPKELSSNYGDLYLNPGRYEGFCLSLIEAMSQGLVPIVFPIGVAPEIIKNGKNGYIVNSVNEMITKIKYLKNNKLKREAMAKEATMTSKQFTAEIMVKKLSKIYTFVSKDNYESNRIK
ncbi:MAG: glycosyltransferase family 4 protein [Candidatus Izemoplasmatales bacterium]|nr:glycosyltransferase family 4 protein [Candidatus Izemoplasmatales bacterium]